MSTESASKATATRPGPGAYAPGAPADGQSAIDPWWDRMRTQLQPRAEEEQEEDAARLDAPPGRRHHAAVPLVVITLLGLVVGFALGERVAQRVATAQVDAGPGSTLRQQLSVSADQANRYVQTQALFLTDPATATAVQKELDLAVPPSYSVRQLDTTSVLEITVSGSDAEKAAEAANAVARAYLVGWRTRSRGAVDRQKAEITSQLAAVTKAVDALSTARLSPADQAKLTALTVQSQALLAQQSALQSDAAAVSSDNRLVRLADARFATTTPSATVTALLGGLVAFLAGLGVLALSRRHS